MVSFSQVKQKLKTSGSRGLLAGVLRHAAKVVEPPRLDGSGLRLSSQDKDYYLDWVRFAVAGMLCDGNVVAFEHAISNLPNNAPVIEIGSFCGLSTIVQSHFLDRYSKTSGMFTCDKWQFEGQALGQSLGKATSVTHDHYREFVRESFLRNMQTFCGNRLPHTVECFSDEFFQKWANRERTVDVFGHEVVLGGEIGFCYIDGNHSYDFAKRDFQNSDRFLVPGGFILFDDSDDSGFWEVNKLTREIAAGGKYELVSKNPNYLFRKK